jgi:hypothetical protein
MRRRLTDGTLQISLNHCRTTGNGVIDMSLNDKPYRLEYKDAPIWGFGVQIFEIPFTSLRRGALNVFRIDLHAPDLGSYGYYWLSDATLSFTAKLPPVTQPNYEHYVKNWILEQRSNIAELSRIPRDDLSAWEFIKNAPAWFYLPFLPAAPSEISVLLLNFPIDFLAVALQMVEINRMARAFHSELLATDLPRKNALRHAYWMALTARAYGVKFADELSNAHEYAHVDLTIEGPFDHVTDKINNAWGIELAKTNPNADCATLVDKAWDDKNLAWAKNFRVENGVQTADIYWSDPLQRLASTYNVIPDFNDWERATLARHNVPIPDKRPIHDEL